MGKSRNKIENRKIIFSRKGFDSEAGGYASPILLDGQLLSLPIPEARQDSKCKNYYNKIYVDKKQKQTYYDVMKLLNPTITRKKEIIPLTKNTCCHLDPHLHYNLEGKNPSGWRGLYGTTTSFSHLINQGVKEGDIILFFGWFRQTSGDLKNGNLSFVKGEYEDKHVIFGYLEIDKIINNPSPKDEKNWMQYHPHMNYPRVGDEKNMLIVAKDKLSVNPKGLPGYGIFKKCDESLILTKKGMSRTKWDLPPCFKGVKISYHYDPANRKQYKHKAWERNHFTCVSRGQDFVVHANDAVIKWTLKLIENNL